MVRIARSALMLATVAAGAALTPQAAEAQWGYYGPGYGGTSFSFGFSTGPHYSYYAPYDYGARPYYGGHVHAPYYGYGMPRQRFEYDIYTPYGRSEVNYRVRRDGSVRVDFDD